MDNNNNFSLQQGMTVYGFDGDKIGDVDVIEVEYFIVRKGFFFPEDHYIPFSAIQSVDGEDVVLNVTKDDALNQEWNQVPAAGGTYVDSANSGEVYNDPAMGVTDVDSEEYVAGTTEDPAYGNQNVVPGEETYVDTDPAYLNNDAARTDLGETEVTDADRGTEAWGQATLREDAGTPVDRSDVEHETIDVVEEDLDYTKREVDRGAVRVDKHVVEEERSVDVPITEEEVHVNRRSVDRPVDNVDFEETTIDVPVHGEEVDVTKTARVVEEIDIDKTATERTETVSDTVRREEVEITEPESADYVDNTDDDKSLLEKAKDSVTPDDDNSR